MKPFSASQLKSYDKCQVRWGFNRLEGMKEPQGKNASKGTAIHAEMERWYGQKNFAGTDLGLFLPTSPEACALAAYVGNVDMLVEVPLSFSLKADWIGFIDGVIFEGNCVYLIDWKTTGNIKYAMTEEELRDDVAANLYAYEAFEGGAVRVVLRWIYIAFGTQKPHEVRVEMDWREVYAKVEEYDARAAQANDIKLQHKRGLLKVLDLEKDFSQCHAFRQDCPFMEQCKPHREVQRIKVRGESDMTSFEAQVSAVTAPASTTLPPIPGSKKTPPPPPTKKTPPPPPAKASPVDDMVARASQGPLVESGIINAPNSPLKLAATPEEAAEAQGIKIVSQSDVAEQEIDLVPAADDLEALDAPQLKLLATSLGLEFLPRARAAGLRELIRNARATKVPADLTPFEQDIVDTTVQLMNSREADILAEYEATEVKLPAAPKAEPTGYDLFVNCAPQGRPYVTLSTLITLLSANFTEVTGCVDYRAVDYGKGPGLMAESLADELSTASGCIVVDTRTHEGAAFCVTLERFARSIVRGF